MLAPPDPGNPVDTPAVARDGCKVIGSCAFIAVGPMAWLCSTPDPRTPMCIGWRPNGEAVKVAGAAYDIYGREQRVRAQARTAYAYLHHTCKPSHAG